MTKKYVVSCFAPPNQLKIESGQTVKVEGWKTKNNVLAKSIVNVTKSGPTCNCGPVPKALSKEKALIGEKVTLKGKVSNIQYSSDPPGVQFDLETE
jgi:hypothetical protein